jgi:hypothetical protein
MVDALNQPDPAIKTLPDWLPGFQTGQAGDLIGANVLAKIP